jgi:NAD+ kinase
MRVLIVAHHEREDAASLAADAAAWLRERGHEAWLSPADALALGLPQLGDDRDPGDDDLALSLGGDGTMLRTVDLVADGGVAVLGVNVGVLGYLAEVEPEGLRPALERVLAGDYAIEERMLLDVTVRSAGRPAVTRRAMNEAVIEKCESGHTVRLLVRIDGAPFTSYVADGLIVATPTGSTAYSLSARGPIVSPHHRALLLTPVSPHMLFDRSLVLDPEEIVEVEVAGHRRADLSVDGQPVATLVEGDSVVCTAAARSARLVRFGERRFHQILKAKFGLNDR